MLAMAVGGTPCILPGGGPTHPPNGGTILSSHLSASEAGLTCLQNKERMELLGQILGQMEIEGGFAVGRGREIYRFLAWLSVWCMFN